jgi:hypothetical protein
MDSGRFVQNATVYRKNRRIGQKSGQKVLFGVLINIEGVLL